MHFQASKFLELCVIFSIIEYFSVEDIYPSLTSSLLLALDLEPFLNLYLLEIILVNEVSLPKGYGFSWI